MKRISIALLISLLSLTTTVKADYETLNIFGGLGIGIGMGGKLYRSENTTATKVTDRFFNYGGGLKLDAGCQYFIMDRVALQGALFLSKGIPSFKETDESDAAKVTTRFGYALYGLKLHIVSKFQVLDLLDTYIGVGTGLYFSSRSFETTRETTSATQSAEGSVSTFPSLGFSAMLGFDFPLNDKTTLFGELGFEQLAFNLNKYKVDESNINGIEAGTVINYEKDAASNNNYPPENISGSSFQIRFGIRYAIF